MTNFYLKNINIGDIVEKDKLVSDQSLLDAQVLYDEIKPKVQDEGVKKKSTIYPFKFMKKLMLEKYQDKVDYDIPDNLQEDYIFCILSGMYISPQQIVPRRFIDKNIDDIKDIKFTIEPKLNYDIEIAQGVKKLYSGNNVLDDIEELTELTTDDNIAKRVIDKAKGYSVETIDVLDGEAIRKRNIKRKYKLHDFELITYRRGRINKVVKPTIYKEISNDESIYDLKSLLKQKYSSLNQRHNEIVSLKRHDDVFRILEQKIFNSISFLNSNRLESTTQVFYDKSFMEIHDDGLSNAYVLCRSFEGETIPFTIKHGTTSSIITFDSVVSGRLIILKDILNTNLNTININELIYMIGKDNLFLKLSNVNVGVYGYVELTISGLEDFGAMVKLYDNGIEIDPSRYIVEINDNGIFIKSLDGELSGLDVYILPIVLVLKGIDKQIVSKYTTRSLINNKETIDVSNRRFAL